MVRPWDVEREIRLQEGFVRERLGRAVSGPEAKDLTDFMHAAAAELRSCPRCHLLVRVEQQLRDATSYEEDSNDRDLMLHLLPRYQAFFENKERVFRPLLRDNAEVLEVAPHIGGFLATVADWNWNATGIDVGRDTVDFLRGQGFHIVQGAIEETSLRTAKLDAVFVWNCFEQLPDPRAALIRIRELLLDWGLLVLRVPNAAFYREVRDVRALAYNNLLGFPYLFGYTPESLNALAASCGYQPVAGFNSELITTPFPDLPPHTEREQREVSSVVGRWSSRTTRRRGSLTGPWIEAVYAKHPAGKPIVVVPPLPPKPQFLRRAA